MTDVSRVARDAFSLRARWVFPVSSPPLDGGLVTIAAGRIVAVGENLSGRPPIDLGNVAILPGLVNAHTHLEFSDLTAPLGEPGTPLPDWIRQVIAWRRQRGPATASSIERGLAEVVGSGTTALGEIRTGAALPAGFDLPLALTEFREVIALDPTRFDAIVGDVNAWLAEPTDSGHRVRGLSPHAPYTVHPELFGRLVESAARHRAPLAMHLAESREELELLATGRGAFRELLEGAGVWNPSAFATPRRPLDYLPALATAPRALVVHGNYLADDEIEFLAAHRDRLSVVYCPRTHAFFGHDRYPLAKMLAAGVRVALGTDSRASNPDLSLWAELQHVAAAFPELPPARVLALATRAGAEALGLPAAGVLAAGHEANLSIVTLPEGETSPADPHLSLWHSATRPSPAIFRGRAADASQQP